MLDKLSVKASVVAIQNYGPSGSLFLQSLLDNHPQILSMPALYNTGFYYFWESKNNLSDVGLVDSFIQRHDYWFLRDKAIKGWGLHQVGENMDQSVYVDQNNFHNHLSNMIPESGFSRKSFFVAIYYAYSLALGRKIEEPVVLLFPIHSSPRHHAQYLVEDFPDTKFIHTIRDPIEGMGSSIKHIVYYKLPVNPLECTFAQIINDYTMCWPGVKRYVYGDRPYFVERQEFEKAIRLEDLHNRPKETLLSLCRWIGVKWDRCLLESTFDGKKWWNRPESVRLSGFGTQVISNKHDDLFSQFDKLRLYCLLYPKYKIWNYDLPLMAKSAFFQIAVFPILLLPYKCEFRLLNYRIAHFRPVRDNFVKVTQLFAKITYVTSDKLKLPLPTQEKLSFLFSNLITLNPVLKSKRFSVSMLYKVFVAQRALYLFLRDTIMIRLWLYRGWIKHMKRPRPEVRLLEIENA